MAAAGCYVEAMEVAHLLLLPLLSLGRALLVAPLLAVPPDEGALVGFPRLLLHGHLDWADPGDGVLGHGHAEVLRSTQHLLLVLPSHIDEEDTRALLEGDERQLDQRIG